MSDVTPATLRKRRGIVRASKTGTGRELRCLYDTVQQHLRALKAMEYEPSGPFITSVLELKLPCLSGKSLARTRRTYPISRGSSNSSIFAQGSKASTPSDHKKTPWNDCVCLESRLHCSLPVLRILPIRRALQVMPTNIHSMPAHSSNHCHMTKQVSLLKLHSICMNCLWPGHFVRQCTSVHHCKKCQKPHHTLLHVESNKGESEKDSSPFHRSCGIEVQLFVDDLSRIDWCSQWLFSRSKSHSWFCLTCFIHIWTHLTELMPPMISPKCQKFRCCWSFLQLSTSHFMISPAQASTTLVPVTEEWECVIREGWVR